MPISIQNRNRAAYDQIVDKYARINHYASAENLRRLQNNLIARLGTRARIVDVGCGTGRDIAWFESQGIHLVGADLSGGMLIYAQKVVSSPLVQMDMLRLGFSAASFDGAWSCASLLHLPKVEAPHALREIRRVLKPGGYLALSLQGGVSEGWERSDAYGVERFFARYSMADTIALLSTNGFKVEEAETTPTTGRTWLSFICKVI